MAGKGCDDVFDEYLDGIFVVTIKQPLEYN